ncbi:SMI1/KNR4 family protein [Salmonella enterica]|uniref:SMI1/KNR4 family protein n=1 Tax=Salmonella enterica TaxID=28901 RepID=UPI0009A9E58A|nr:SMI1/KNR4 family protein [Salmonella enterica]HBC0155118.1 SMI1/KNR4 family protein [Salmonella enterica subsp. indica]
MKILEHLDPYCLKDGTDKGNIESYSSFFPDEYIELIYSCCGKIGFNHDIVVDTIDIIPHNRCKCVAIDYFYGNSKGAFGLSYNIESAFNVMPNNEFIVFAECPGGNYICINKKNKKIYFFGTKH